MADSTGRKWRPRSTLFSLPLVQAPKPSGVFAAVQTTTSFGCTLLLPRYPQTPCWPLTCSICLGKLLWLGWMWKGGCKAVSFICLFLKFNKTRLTRKWLHAFQAWIQRRIAADLVWSVVISFHTMAQDFFFFFFFLQIWRSTANTHNIAKYIQLQLTLQWCL